MLQSNRQVISNEMFNLLRERKNILTPDEREIVKDSLYCNEENKNDIIIERYKHIYF